MKTVLSQGKGCPSRSIKTKFNVSALLAVGLIATLSGCAKTPTVDINAATPKAGVPSCDASTYQNIRPDRKAADHIIRLDPDGLMVDPRDNHRRLDYPEAEKALAHIYCEAELLAKERGSDQVRILFYVHGGLNSFGNTDSKIEDGQAFNIMDDEDEWHYPVYISWNSAALSSWGEHLFQDREGKKAEPVIGILTSPVVLTSDLLTTVGRFPMTVYYQLSNEKDRLASAYMPGALSGSWRTAIEKFPDVEGNKSSDSIYHGKKTGLQANISGYDIGTWKRTGRGSLQLVTFPIRYTLGSLWHSSISSSAWDVMKRRTQTPYAPPHYFDGRWDQGVPGSYVFPWLFSVMDLDEHTYDISLIGHSMGTMFLNHALTSYQQDWVDSGSLNNIVYMAAAADMETSFSALSPILKSSSKAGSRPVNFYNLTLNRVAEVSEMHVGGVVPTGSLLISIDQHHERPEHPLRRTLGSEINVLSSIDVIDETLAGAKGTLVFKSFDRNDGDLPKHHGDFGHMTFWRSSTWEIQPQ